MPPRCVSARPGRSRGASGAAPAFVLASALVAFALAAASCGPYDVFATGRDAGCDTEDWTCQADTAIDHRTGLEWERHAPADLVERASATARCDTLTLAGGGWRLPTVAELKGLLTGAVPPRIDLGVFPGTPGALFWAQGASEGLAGTVDFAEGESSTESDASEAAVRCVRTST